MSIPYCSITLNKIGKLKAHPSRISFSTNAQKHAKIDISIYVTLDEEKSKTNHAITQLQAETCVKGAKILNSIT